MRRTAPEQVGSLLIPTLDVLAKLALFSLVLVVAVDPTWANLEGKAPGLRAVTYPLTALTVPVWWWLRRPGTPYPWLPDALLTYVGFSDVLGNRLDLFDNVVWFDDWTHFANITCVSSAVVLLTLDATASWRAVLERAVAVGMSVGLGWEVFEYFGFLTRSGELPTAYGDTLGDLGLGWLGAALAASLVHLAWRHHLPEHPRVVPEPARLDVG